MKKVKKILFFFILLPFLHACGSLSEAGKVLRNEKIKTTDEFLVKKRTPLVLPPDYDSLPTPGSAQKEKANQESSINEIFKMPQEQGSSSTKTTSVEQSIINKIGK